MAVSDLLIDLEGILVADFDFTLHAAIFVRTGVGLIGQEVLQVDGQAVAGGDPQYQRTRTLVGAQRHLARHRGAALSQGYLMIIDHIATQGEDHAVNVLRTEAVEHQRLIQRHDVGHQIALTARSRFGQLDAEHRGRQQQQMKDGWNVENAGHDHGPRCGCSQGIILDNSVEQSACHKNYVYFSYSYDWHLIHRGIIPHLFPTFSPGPPCPNVGENHPTAFGHSGASADKPCKRRYWRSTLGT